MEERAEAEKRERNEEGGSRGGAESLIGRTLGGYRIDGLLGHGSTGTVYKATQLSVERTVALKVLAPSLARNRKFVIGFVASVITIQDTAYR